MMAGLPITRLAKLIPVLSSDKDGEVLAAARAIGRALKSAGCDFHDLTAAINGKTPHVIEKIVYRDRPEPPKPQPPKPEDHGFASLREQVLALAPVFIESGKLWPGELKFVTRMLENAHDYSVLKMTEKQLNWWQAIVKDFV